ncbi:MAG: hypothetical protein WDA60_18830 [Acidimicrobiia bacterium]|jgi:hypothetical protein
MRRRPQLIPLLLLACTVGTGLVAAAPARAASVPNPCKVVKFGDIAKVFGAKPAGVTRQAREISSTSCSFQLADTPDDLTGEVIVTVTFANAKTAYNGLDRDARYQPLTAAADGIDGMYAPLPLSVVHALKGSKMLSVQGYLVDMSAQPPTDAEVQDQLVALAGMGLKRV